MPLTAKSYLKISPEFIQEVATGLEEGEEIAKRFGFTKSEWKIIEKRKDFQTAVARVVAERERSGDTFRLKAHVMADKLLDNMFSSALAPDIPVKDKAAALQLLTKVANLEPKDSQQASQGSGFSITINVPTPKPETIVVEAKSKSVEKVPDEAPVLDMEFKDGQAD